MEASDSEQETDLPNSTEAEEKDKKVKTMKVKQVVEFLENEVQRICLCDLSQKGQEGHKDALNFWNENSD